MSLSPPFHGGNLTAAAQEFGGSVKDWLDLSTGISPWAYPELELSESCWRKLPDDGTSLRTAAANYYGCRSNDLRLTPGSQLAIRLLPTLIKSRQSVAVPAIGYKEHQFAWANSGHRVVQYTSFTELDDLLVKRNVNSVVLINPNNPTGDIYHRQQLLRLAARLEGILVVDEAFADFDNIHSLCRESTLSNIIVLRSLGKFFGLAGARVGFTITQHTLGRELNSLLSPWSISAPAQIIAERALRDSAWQAKQRQRIRNESDQLTIVLQNFINKSGLSFKLKNQKLFITLFGNDSQIRNLHLTLAQQKIWTRIGDSFINTGSNPQNWLRFSLAGQHSAQLHGALNRIRLT